MINGVINISNQFTCVIMSQLGILATTGDVSVVLLPVVEEREDGVDEQEEDHAEDDDLFEADAELRRGHVEWRNLGGRQTGIGIV